MEVVTITFCEQAENHVGMQKIGIKAENGFECGELRSIAEKLKLANISCEIVDLKIDELVTEEASVLVIRNGVSVILNKSADVLQYEHSLLDVDKKALMRGRVVNKLARHNLCFDDTAQEPDYVKGKGRIVAFEDVPVTNQIRTALPNWFGNKAHQLKAEGNYYYDSKKCYIGWHGDSERKRVIAARLGHSFPLYFQWYFQTEPIGPQFRIDLNHGDMYCMSEKATGNDWKRRTEPTLRHAASGSAQNIRHR
jgi:hypothetical protein